jgi:uncharacterized protein YbcI
LAEGESTKIGHVLAEVSNAMVALHREHFGRGAGAAKTLVTDDMVVCVLHDIYTSVERTLIRAGQSEHVRRTRALHQEALKHEYRSRIEPIVGRPVKAFLSVVNIDPDVAVEIFLLSPDSDG